MVHLRTIIDYQVRTTIKIIVQSPTDTRKEFARATFLRRDSKSTKLPKEMRFSPCLLNQNKPSADTKMPAIVNPAIERVHATQIGDIISARGVFCPKFELHITEKSHPYLTDSRKPGE